MARYSTEIWAMTKNLHLREKGTHFRPTNEPNQTDEDEYIPLKQLPNLCTREHNKGNRPPTPPSASRNGVVLAVRRIVGAFYTIIILSFILSRETTTLKCLERKICSRRRRRRRSSGKRTTMAIKSSFFELYLDRRRGELGWVCFPFSFAMPNQLSHS